MAQDFSFVKLVKGCFLILGLGVGIISALHYMTLMLNLAFIENKPSEAVRIASPAVGLCVGLIASYFAIRFFEEEEE